MTFKNFWTFICIHLLTEVTLVLFFLFFGADDDTDMRVKNSDIDIHFLQLRNSCDKET